MTQEEKEKLLEEAKRRYPIGTRYIPAHVNIGINEVIKDDYRLDFNCEYIHVSSKKIEQDWNDCIYYKGKWAKIVSKPEEKTIEVDYDKVDWNNVKNLRVKWLKNVYDNKNKIEKIIDNKHGADCILLEGFGICSIGRFKLNEIAFIDKPLMIKEEKSIEKPQFEVGKWYSFNWDWNGSNSTIIAKIQEVREIAIDISWRSYLWREKDYSSSDTYEFRDISNVKELSIEEIQQYLPDGHPDKIETPKSLVGRYIKILKNPYSSASSEKTKEGTYLKITKEKESNNTFYTLGDNGYSDFWSKERLKNNEFELMPEGFEPFKEEIPEYVENVNYFSEEKYKGKIYNTKKDKPDTIIDFTWKNLLIDCKRLEEGCFKISTKEAYEAQQKRLEYPLTEKECFKEEWIPKVGDWVVVTNCNKDYNPEQKEFIGQIDSYNSPYDYWIKNHNIQGAYENYKRICCDTYPFRKAEPHEILASNSHTIKGPINTTIALTKPEIDSWCIQLTEENKELLKQNRNVFKEKWSFDNVGAYYGISQHNLPTYSSTYLRFDKVLTTEEFCKKFNILIENMTLTKLTSMYQSLEKEEIQQSKTNKIKAKLIPVKKLIKN